MALQIYNTTVLGSGVQVDLGTTDDLYVGKDGYIASTDSYAIHATGSNHSVTVEGSIFSSDWTIWLGSITPVFSSGQQLIIGKHALVSSSESVAVGLIGYGNSLKNDGTIQGATGVDMDGGSGSGLSELVNNGEIHATKFNAVERTGSEDFEFTNNGAVKSDGDNAYYGFGSNSTGDQTLINNGRMIGEVYFGDGNDIYSGAHGKITNGYVRGYGGNDLLTGGTYSDNFLGGAGRDIQRGGGAADHFIFTSADDSTIDKSARDLILDFSHAQHDKLDLSAIDAAASSGGTDEAFSFMGSQAFSGSESELHCKFVGASTFVQGDIDGDKHADFSIELKGHIALHAGDFIL